MFLHRITDLTMILVAKCLERKCRMQSKKSEYSRGAQTESSHIYMDKRRNLTLPRWVPPSNHLNSALKWLLSPSFLPLGEKWDWTVHLVTQGAHHWACFCLTSFQTLNNPLEQQRAKERGGHLLQQVLLCEIWKTHITETFFSIRENEMREALSPEFWSTLHETKFLSYLILSREQPVEPGSWEQLAVNSRKGRASSYGWCWFPRLWRDTGQKSTSSNA